jgi:Raf kinase inhibitor-like YbhB/YbcL family protein
MAAHVKRTTALLVLVLLAFCGPGGAQNSEKLTVTSSAFATGAPIPATYGCKDPNSESPPLAWQGVPHDAKTLVLILKDPDAPGGTFIHWVVYNLPASLTGLDAKVPPIDKLANGGSQGANDLGQIGYKGPCPPPGSAPHHYHFELTAVDMTLSLKPGATAAQVEEAIQGHVKRSCELVGTFAR